MTSKEKIEILKKEFSGNIIYEINPVSIVGIRWEGSDDDAYYNMKYKRMTLFWNYSKAIYHSLDKNDKNMLNQYLEDKYNIEIKKNWL